MLGTRELSKQNKKLVYRKVPGNKINSDIHEEPATIS